ncbi:MAG: hypothetical protein HYU36_24080 [Planctomycetes bacterium]|nr:hypothetical protein [Planctomycetota bacterium]
MLEELTTLPQMEQRLGEALRRIELICELPFTDADDARLRQVLVEELGRGVERGAWLRLARDYPCSLACFLVQRGIREYREGEFWTPVGQAFRTELPQNIQTEWGQAFERLLDRYQLPRFADTGGCRYMTPILAHGGIPDYCLEDLFTKLLIPAVQGKLAYSGNVEDILEDWKARPSLFYLADQPVRRFLSLGGKVAQDFLARSLDMASEGLETGAVGDASVHGVPPRVRDKFEAFLERSGNLPRRSGTRSDTGQRFRSPEMRFNSCSTNLLLTLPAVELPASQTSLHHLRWEIRRGQERAAVFTARCTRRGGKIEILPEEITIENPAEDVQIVLSGGNTRWKEWKLPGFTSERPWLAFDVSTGRQLRSHPLTRGRFWLVCEAIWQVSPSTPVREEMELCGTCVARRMEMDAAGEIRLHQISGDCPDRLVSVAPPAWSEARLEGGGRLEWPPCRCPALPDAEVFAGELPSLVLPPLLGGRDTFETATLTWREFSRSGNQRKTVRLTEILGKSLFGSGPFRIPLADSKLLGSARPGLFEIRIRGRLGQDRKFLIALLPALSLECHVQDLIPEPSKGAQAVSIRLSMPGPSKVRLADMNPGGPVLRQEGTGESYDLLAPPTCSTVPLIFEVPGSEPTDGGPTEIPMEFAIPRLEWALSGLEHAAVLRYGGKTLETTLQQFEQAERPTLMVRSGFPGVVISHLVFGHGQRRVSRDLHPGRTEYLLGSFLDALRADPSVLKKVYLEFFVPGVNGDSRVEVLAIRTVWEVEGLEASLEASGGRRRLRIRWTDKTPLKNRLVRLWNLADGGKVIEVKVPDDRSEMVLNFSAERLPDGNYRLELALEDPWTPAALPDDYVPNIRDLHLRGDRVVLTESVRYHLDGFLETLVMGKPFECPCDSRLVKLIIEREEFADQVWNAMRERIEAIRSRLTEGELSKDFASALGSLFDAPVIDVDDLRERLAASLLRDVQRTGAGDLSSLFVRREIEEGVLQRPWGESWGHLLQEQAHAFLPGSGTPAFSDLQKLYEQVQWSRPALAAQFIQVLGKASRGLVLTSLGCRVLGVELSREDHLYPLVVSFRSKRQSGLPRGVSMRPGRSFLNDGDWHRVVPKRWSEKGLCTALAYFQRGFAWGLLGVSEETTDGLDHLGRSFFNRLGSPYLETLLQAEREMKRFGRREGGDTR